MSRSGRPRAHRRLEAMLRCRAGNVAGRVSSKPIAAAPHQGPGAGAKPTTPGRTPRRRCQVRLPPELTSAGSVKRRLSLSIAPGAADEDASLESVLGAAGSLRQSGNQLGLSGQPAPIFSAESSRCRSVLCLSGFPRSWPKRAACWSPAIPAIVRRRAEASGHLPTRWLTRLLRQQRSDAEDAQQFGVPLPLTMLRIVRGRWSRRSRAEGWSDARSASCRRCNASSLARHGLAPTTAEDPAPR